MLEQVSAPVPVHLSPTTSTHLHCIQVPADSADLKEYYSLALAGGGLRLRVNGGTGELLLSAAGTFSDGRFHTVSVIKTERRWAAQLLPDRGGIGAGTIRD